MCFTACFEQILGAVAEVTEISKEKILSTCRDQETSDSRCLLIFILHNKYNVSLRKIGESIGKSTQAISYHLKNFELRKSQNWMFRIQYEEIIKKLQSNKQLTF